MTNSPVRTPWKLPALLCLLLVLPEVALAAEPSVSKPVDPVHPVLRVGAEMTGELLLSLGGGIVGTYAGVGACGTIHSSIVGNDCWVTAGYGFMAGTMLAAPLGVWAGGRLADGHGTLAGSYIGAGVGAGTGLLVNMMVTNQDMTYFFPPVLSMVGAIVGYEVSHSSETKAQQASLTRFQPMLSVSEKGGALGLSGSF